MARQSIRIVLASGVMIAVGLVGVAAAKGTSSKTSDRLPLADGAPASLMRVAALGHAFPPGPPPGPEGPRSVRFDGAGGPPPFAGPSGHPPFGPMAHRGPGAGPHGGPPCRDPMEFARTLAAAETAIGIRTDQLDAWRGFTDALLAAAPPPPPPPGRGPHQAAKDAPRMPSDALAGVEGLANRLQEQGKAGARLAEAAQTLKSRLSADQLERMARLGPALMPPPPGRPFPPPPFGGPGADDMEPPRPPAP